MIRRSFLFALVCLVGASCSSDDSAPDGGGATVATAAATSSPASAATDGSSVEDSGPADTGPADTASVTTSPSTTAAPSTAAPTTAAPTTVAATTSMVPVTAAPYVSAIYADTANWICRPDTTDLCDSDLEVTVVAPDGTATVEPFAPAVDADVDCFYLYPTTSEDRSINSDFVAGAELATTRAQAGPFAEVCNVYAPIYRSVTLPALFGQVEGDRAAGQVIAYGDALDSWRHYLANDNDGRGVILIGHSQGSSHLARILREEIDPSAAVRELIVSAYITGSSVTVPLGADVGGDLKEIPLCRALDQTGCVVTYATFRSTAPPPENSFFGRPRRDQPGMAGCVNPAAPGGGSAPVSGAYASGDWALADKSLVPATAFMDFPGLVTAECKYENGFSYLELTVRPDPADPRTDDLFGVDLTPEWGTHIGDISALSGSLVEMARQQIEAYTAS
jgi:hypothetical protein